jgi:hypothetical protein
VEPEVPAPPLVEPELDVPVEPEVPELLEVPDAAPSLGVVLPGRDDELLPELLGLVEELELGLLDVPLEP